MYRGKTVDCDKCGSISHLACAASRDYTCSIIDLLAVLACRVDAGSVMWSFLVGLVHVSYTFVYKQQPCEITCEGAASAQLDSRGCMLGSAA